MQVLETANTLLRLRGGDSGLTIIDGGCHHGVFARKAMEFIPDAHILAFEPDPESFKLASASLARHGSVEIVNAALGETPGHAEFFRGTNTATNSLSPRPTAAMKPYYPEKATLSAARRFMSRRSIANANAGTFAMLRCRNSTCRAANSTH